ncbi:MAG: hypothetical protein KDE46_02115 [Caldilineaceae bacterium]|nr:hypothetical protein [Caldilineaceae bacterium]
MSERSMFDHSWERQDQWGGEWHSLNGRFIVAGDLLQRDLAQSAAPPRQIGRLMRWWLGS